MFCSVLLFLVARDAQQSGRPFVAAWGFLGLSALFVAVDEGAQIHELLDRNPQWTAGLFEARGALDGP